MSSSFGHLMLYQFQSLDLVFHVPEIQNNSGYLIFFCCRRRKVFFFTRSRSRFTIHQTGACQLIPGNAALTWLQSCADTHTSLHDRQGQRRKNSGRGAGVVRRLPRWNILTVQSTLARTKGKERNQGCETRGWFGGGGGTNATLTHMCSTIVCAWLLRHNAQGQRFVVTLIFLSSPMPLSFRHKRNCPF